MRVLVDATTWDNPRGFGRYTRSLVGRLIEIDGDNDYVLLFDRRVPNARPGAGRARAVAASTSSALNQVLTGGASRPLGDVWRMSVAATRQAPDVVFFPTVDTWFPLAPGVPSVVTVHDAIPEIHPEMTVLSSRARMLRRLKVWVALRRAGRVVVDSEHARRDVCRVHGLAERRTVVVPCGAADVFRPPMDRAVARASAAELGASPPYLLYVGGPDRHKNLAALVDAFARVVRRGDARDVSLVVVGPPMTNRADAPRPGSAMPVTAEELGAAYGVADRVRQLGFRDDPTLAILYQAAEALVVPSLREGFGLTGVEAAACGTPAVVTRESPLPELLGDAAVSVDPHSVEDIARGLTTVLCDAAARGRMRAAAVARAGAFSWSAGAETLRATLDEVGTRRRRTVPRQRSVPA